MHHKSYTSHPTVLASATFLDVFSAIHFLWQQFPLQITVLPHSGSLTFNLFSIRRKWQVTQAARCRQTLCKNGHCSNSIQSFCFRKSSGDMCGGLLLKTVQTTTLDLCIVLWQQQQQQRVVNFDFRWKENWDSPDPERGCLRCARFYSNTQVSLTFAAPHRLLIPVTSSQRHKAGPALLTFTSLSVREQLYSIWRNPICFYEEIPFVSVWGTAKTANDKTLAFKCW